MSNFFDHDDECDKLLYEGGICTCGLTGGRDDYDDEPSNMDALENGQDSREQELW